MRRFEGKETLSLGNGKGVTGPVAVLAGGDAAYTTGQTVNVDGGLNMS